MRNQRQRGDPSRPVGDHQRVEAGSRRELLDPLRQQFGASGRQCRIGPPPEIVPGRRFGPELIGRREMQ